MKIGAMLFPTDTSIQPIPFGEALEERGFDSVWFPEHSHIPTSLETPWGGLEGAPPLPEHYWRTHDQLIALAAIAGRTERLKLATGITLVAQRDPIWLAKQVASLDMISGGRFILGVGYGWNKEEMAQHGVEYRSRRDLVHEKLRMMQALWTQDEAVYEGEMLHLESSWSWPKPIQQPHPPIVMGGGAGPKMYAAIAEFAAGWAPLGRIQNLAQSVEEMREAVAAAGRDPGEIEISIFQARPRPDKVEEWVAAGVTQLILDVPSLPTEQVLEVLDGYRPLMGELG
jgi:probable F420-dependent oxidoreductase